MDKQAKLPKEVQEIIKYYGDLPANEFHQVAEILNGLLTELSPYLEDTFLPNFLKGENREFSLEKNRQENQELAMMLCSDRKKPLELVEVNEIDSCVGVIGAKTGDDRVSRPVNE